MARACHPGGAVRAGRTSSLHSRLVAAAWDRRSAAQLRSAREAALRAQLVDAVGPFSPFWRQRLTDLGGAAQTAGTPAGLAELPAVGERDVCPDGDPRGAAALVLQAGERGWVLHAEGPRLRRALVRRLVAPRSYAAVVEADTRATSFVWAGLGMRFPVASTRGDLDVVARVGARLWQVLGLTRADVLVASAPDLPDAEHQALSLAALGAGAPALFTAPDPGALAGALRLLPATVLALPSAAAGDLLHDLARARAPLAGLRTVLLVGAPSTAEREHVAQVLDRAGAGDAVALAVHVADGHRLPWAQCRESAASDQGLHAMPDLEVLHVVDPETGEATAGAGELVLTQLGLRGSALVRWRTGDLVEAVVEDPCPACGRRVPRVLGLRRNPLVHELQLREGTRAVDLRAVTAALAGRGDLADWRVELALSPRDRTDELLVHVVPGRSRDPVGVAVAVARDVQAVAGLLPTQVVLAAPGELPDAAGPTRRVLADR